MAGSEGSSRDGGQWVDDVLRFWFDELGPKGWFTKSDATDGSIRERFGALIESVAAESVEGLLADGDTALAAAIVLDQVPRNVFRATPRAFAYDGTALALARSIVQHGLDRNIAIERRVFVYLPFEHSEDAADQDRAVTLISAIGDPMFTRYAEAHRDVIYRFGRFPHRNAILGRVSTPDEAAYLAQPGSGF